MMNILFIFMYLVACITGHRIDSMQNSVKENLDIERELKLINKTPVKSIHTKYGYIVDCIDINKQPAFDHPLLKNHKLQRKPNFANKIKKDNVMKSSTSEAIFGLDEKDQCPSGSVPIRRTNKNELIRAKSYFSNVLLQNSPGFHVAQVTLRTVPKYFSYYGVGGTSSIYNLKVEKDQSSTAMMWVIKGHMDNLNLIGVGWHVAPYIYEDDATHLFTVWTTDNFKNTGCFNLLCSGFVQTNKKIYLGGRFDNTSIYGGVMAEITFSIIQDPDTKNWWLINKNQNIGYFPASLFSNLTSAGQVGWGGKTTTSPGSPSPPMGSGYFPDNVFNHACYFRHVTFQNDSRQDFGPEDYLVDTFSDKPNCYSAEFYGNERSDVGYCLQFGGPGGRCND
ncbi:unnamed protein product [Trifolium pratense]|uniref:Uncharacterized protein n=1 Tax=Trifolium pratense TaxID=57577 RepID=A0ACB0K784_TRIPR|nr:unnamed protein product [Trifolium pratense]